MGNEWVEYNDPRGEAQRMMDSKWLPQAQLVVEGKERRRDFCYTYDEWRSQWHLARNTCRVSEVDFCSRKQALDSPLEVKLGGFGLIFQPIPPDGVNVSRPLEWQEALTVSNP